LSPPSGSTVTSRPRRRWLAPAVAAATAAIVIAVVVVGLGGSGAGVPATPAATLGQAAVAVARNRQPAALGPGQFWYTRTTELRRLPLPILVVRPPSFAHLGKGMKAGGRPHPATSTAVALSGVVSVVRRETTETWVGLDGTVRTRTVAAGPAAFATPGDKARLLASGQPLPAVPGSSDMTVQGDGRFPAGQDLFSYRQLLALPTDPRALYRQIRRALVSAATRGRLEYAQTSAQLKVAQAGATGGHVVIGAYSIRGSEAGAALDAVVGLLESPVPAPVRAALYRAAALVPGVRLDGTVRDSLGRPGIGISAGPPKTWFELILDPATGALIGQRSPLLGDSATVVAGVAPSIGGVPSGAAPVPGPASLTRVPLAVLPAIGTPRTTFSVSVGQPGAGGRYSFVVIGPSRPTCRATLIPTILGPAQPGPGAGPGPGRSQTFPLAPPAAGGGARRAWCPGSYQVQVLADGLGRGSGQLGTVRFQVR
jgi:hypothetical protein